MIIRKIKIIDQSMKDYYLNHSSAYDDDAGIDLFISEDYLIEPHTFSNILKTGVCLEMTNQYNCSISYFLAPRSSISKSQLRLSYSPGIIDAGYRGELRIYVDNLSNNKIFVEKGLRIVQVVAPNLEKIKVTLVDELSRGSRGKNGIGSSGLNGIISSSKL